MPAQGPLLARVSSAITRRMANELPTLATTAADVRVPERTLQRRLAEEGVSHSALVDDVRRALAVKYLGSANVSVTEIAYMLHFADPTVFSRAFKRWTGESPAAYRKRLF
jgi:AraC-like DNA-binding protein